MVNEERLRHMIKMAAFDANEGKKCKPMIQYARHDYVSLQLLRGFVAGTLAFGMIFGLWALYSMDRLMQEINTMDLMGFLTSILIKYLIFMAVYLAATFLVFNGRYTKGRRKVKNFFGCVKKVNKLYVRDEKLKSTGNRERN